MSEYTTAYDPSAGPEDHEANRCYEVVHRQAWQNGAWLPPVARGCTKEDAERIAQALGRKPFSREEILAIVEKNTVRWIKSDDMEIFSVRIARAIEEAHGIKEST